MDDPSWAWPAWKFGMKTDDLFTTLHSKYNTFSFAIQDAEAFHHDVYEICHDADTVDDLHRLLADRRRQRLSELNESLESLAVEIIANPKLIATDQWQHALQLFRTKSFDSIVRFFSSYLPDDYLDRHETYSSSSSFSESASVHTESTKASSVDDAIPCSPFFVDHLHTDKLSVITEEPCSLDDADNVDVDACPITHGVEAPLSPPESEPMLAEETVSSPTDVESQGYTSTNPPSRSMSFGSECGAFGPDLIRSSLIQDDEASQSSDCDSVVVSVSDTAESQSSLESVDAKVHDLYTSCCSPDDEDYFPTSQLPEDDFDILDTTDDILESDTSTPRPQPDAITTSYVEYKSIMARRLPPTHQRSPSPKSTRTLRGEGLVSCGMRRTPEESSSKIQKPTADSSRKRPKGRI